MAADPADDRAVDACDAHRAIAQAFVDRLSRLVDDGPCVWRDVTELLDEKLGTNLTLLEGLGVEVANLHALVRSVHVDFEQAKAKRRPQRGTCSRPCGATVGSLTLASRRAA